MPTSVALGSHFEEFLKSQLDSGRYNNASEIIREGLRLLENREQLRLMQIDALKAEIQKGVDSPRKSLDEVFDRLEAKYQSMIDAK